MGANVVLVNPQGRYVKGAVTDMNGNYNLQVPADATKEQVEQQALADERTAKYTDGKQIIKTIVVPKKIINIVVK